LRRRAVMLGTFAMKRPASGFTLLEIMLAVAIAVMLLVIAVPSLTSLFADEGVQQSFTDFDRFVQQAQDRAIKEKRTVLLVWTKDGIEAVADAPEGSEAGGPIAFAYPADGSITIDRPWALDKKAPMEWAFFRSGACEPVQVHYESKAGDWTADYEPLTGRGKIVTMQAK
jgi:prepilin-type N-terminal cleavage/methylation domain-containing protein